MFVVSMKTNKKKLLGYTLVGLIVIIALIAIFSPKGSKNAKKTAGSTEVKVQTNEDRISYLKTFGWTVSDEATEICEVAIPSEFNDVYNVYNKIQKQQGFNLEDYKGKRVKRFTYEVTNYPNEPENVRANLLILDDKVIGGDVSSTKLDGFMHTLKMQK